MQLQSQVRAAPGSPVSGAPRPAKRIHRDLTPAQDDAIHALGAAESAVRPAAVGSDVFVYVERTEATVRFQLNALGELVDRTRFEHRVADQPML